MTAEMGDRLATIDMGRKVGAAVPLSVGGAGSPSNTVTWAEAYLHTKWHRDPSNVLPQYTNVTDRQDRQTEQDNCAVLQHRTKRYL